MNNVTGKRNIIFIIGLIIILLFFYKIGDIALLFFIAFILASALDPVINWLSRKMPRIFAVISSGSSEGGVSPLSR